METISIRLPSKDMVAIEDIAKQQGIPKSQAFRQVVQRGLSSNATLNQKMLIEILMIVRSSIKSDAQYEKILKTIDEFKTIQGLNHE